MSENGGTAGIDQIICDYSPLPFIKYQFYLVTVAGSTIGGIGIVCNLMLLYLFLCKIGLKASGLYHLTEFMVFITDCMHIITFTIIYRLHFSILHRIRLESEEYPKVDSVGSLQV